MLYQGKPELVEEGWTWASQLCLQDVQTVAPKQQNEVQDIFAENRKTLSI
jgi:hypothetical protein